MISQFSHKLGNLPGKKGAFLVGGAVRDLLLGRSPLDFDIAVTEDAEGFARKLAGILNASFVPLGRPGQNLFRVVCPDVYYDITPLNGRNLEEDLKNRDFTVNALAYSLEEDRVIDCTGGLPDLENRRIRMVSEQVFVHDPLRLLRTFRMGAALGFAIDTETLNAVRQYAHLIGRTAGERIRVELLKMLAVPHSFPWLEQMTESGLLFDIIPEMKDLRGCTQNRFHAFDVLNHTLKAFESMESMIRGELCPEMLSPMLLDEGRLLLLKMAVLLHDVGKPPTRTADPQGEHVHFYGHEKKGDEMAERILTKLKFSNQEIRYICAVIRGHLRPLLLYRARQKNTLKQKGIIRFFIKSGEYTPLLLLHALADDRAKSEMPETGDFGIFVQDIFRLYLTDYLQKKSEMPLINGHDLIREFGLQPSPDFKRILDTIEEARLNGRIRTKEEALKLAKGCLK